MMLPEEGYLLRIFIGEDDKYPKDHRGQPREPVRFTIRAEKCPNRKGVEAVLKHFQGGLVSFDDVASGKTPLN